MSASSSPPAGRRWWALALIALAQFIVIMDTSIIGVALPRMRELAGRAPPPAAPASSATRPRSPAASPPPSPGPA